MIHVLHVIDQCIMLRCDIVSYGDHHGDHRYHSQSTLWLISLNTWYLRCISYILSIATVWYTCHRSMVHVNDWYCILSCCPSIMHNCHSITAWCVFVMLSYYDTCSKCYRSMHYAQMRYCAAWGPSVSFSINTLWQPERLTWSV